MRYRAAIPVLFVLLGLLAGNLYHPAAPVAGAAAPCTLGCMDMSFFYQPAGAGRPLVQTPTGEKPQSKLWFHDGSWWGSLFNNVAGKYHIYRLNWTSQVWEDTGVVLDPRPESKADVLWDGAHLYVASGGGADSTGTGTRKELPALLFRYSYAPASRTYALDPGFPVTIRDGGAETIVIDKDTTGTLWITYTQNSKVYVNHSLGSDAAWNPAAAMVLNVSGVNPNVSPDDISSLVAADGKIGVLWSNQTDNSFYFAYHVDGTPDTSWIGKYIYRQTDAADDHLNLKALQTDSSGNFYAVVKTSYNALGSPQLLLIVGKKQGAGYTWNVYIHSYRQDGQTRPMLLIDSENRKLYVFTSDEGGGRIFYKSTSMDNIQFDSGAGTLFMTANGYALNNVTSTKQAVRGASGIVVMASHENQTKIDSSAADFYFHNYLTLPGAAPTATPKPSATPPAPVTPTPTNPPSSLNNRLFVPVIQR